jgi:hypothetical protein
MHMSAVDNVNMRLVNHKPLIQRTLVGATKSDGDAKEEGRRLPATPLEVFAEVTTVKRRAAVYC